ncbi:MAG: RsmD family RNA methyltransferase, partial [Acidobacteriaceae bacterium]|nr:RsmD family RNA methyltransferase [Acidobacteriaceae bacterium]
MRVIAGTLRSRPLKSVPGLAVRPTPGRLREALFNVLAPRIEGATFIDAYAGSGAVGIEAVSRGAGRVILIERSP